MDDQDNDFDKISSFKELLGHIAWSWEYPQYDFHKQGDTYSLNKLYIMPNMIQYKAETYYLAEGVYESFEAFYNLLQMMEKI